jgi:hypothetical protein
MKIGERALADFADAARCADGIDDPGLSHVFVSVKRISVRAQYKYGSTAVRVVFAGSVRCNVTLPLRQVRGRIE